MRQKPYYKCYEQTRMNKKKLDDKSDEDGNKNTNTIASSRHDTERGGETETASMLALEYVIWCCLFPTLCDSQATHTAAPHTHTHTDPDCTTTV